MCVSCAIELGNIVILAAASDSQLDIIGNFIIMLVLADFDKYFYAVR